MPVRCEYMGNVKKKIGAQMMKTSIPQETMAMPVL